MTRRNSANINNIPAALIAAPPTGGFPKLAPSGLPDGVANSWGLDDRMKTPYSHVFDFSVSRELPSSFVLDVAYIGRLGRRLLQEEDMAMPLDLVDKQSGMDYFSAATLLSKAAAANTPIQTLAKIPYWENMFPGAAGVYDGADFGGCTPGGATLPGNFSPTATQAMYSSYACALHNETLPLIFADVPGELGLGPNPCFPACSKLGPYAYFNPQFTSLYSWRNAGTSSYHALQVTIRRGMTQGLQWDFNYTYSKSIDIGSNAERVNEVDAYFQADQIINSWSPAQLRGVSDFDTTHQLNTNWVYELPFGHGKRFAASRTTAGECLTWRLAVVWASTLDQWLPNHHRDIHSFSRRTGTCRPLRSSQAPGPRLARSLIPEPAIPTCSKIQRRNKVISDSPIQESRDNATSFAGPATSESTVLSASRG